jgi:N-methylhydantoinase A/oxoprolinase/acetone carboxylase beta subunit
VTVTDANLLLGRLDPDYFLGGRMALDRDRALGVMTDLAATLRMNPLDLADGVVRVANANMVRAIRVVSEQRGHDPRDFALVAFGGAGGMHACEMAEVLDIGTVIVPRHAGVLSALGMLLAEVTKDYSQSVLRPVSEAPTAWLDQRFAALEAQAANDLGTEGFEPSRVRLERLVDVRYVGQSYEIMVPFGVDFRAEFDRRHEQSYGYANPARAAEIVNVRVKAIGVTDKPELPVLPATDARLPEPVAMREAWFGRRRCAMPVFHVESLPRDASGAGPALLAGAQATTVVPLHHRFRIDALGNVVATRAAVAARLRAPVLRRGTPAPRVPRPIAES